MSDPRPISRKGIVLILGACAAMTFVVLENPMPVEPRTDPAKAPEVLRRIEGCVAAKPEIEEHARDPRFQYDRTLLERVEAVNRADPDQCGEFSQIIRRRMDAAIDFSILGGI